MSCCCQNQRPSIPVHDAHFVGPPMDALVGETVESRRVGCVDLGCHSVVTVIGVAMIIFAAIAISNAVHQPGWIVHPIPFYTTLATVEVAGIIVTILSLKWIVEECQKWHQFENDVKDII